MVIGVLFLAVYGFQHRDEILGMLTGGGKGLPGVSALPAPADTTTSDNSSSSSSTPAPTDKTSTTATTDPKKTTSSSKTSSSKKKKKTVSNKKKSHFAYSYTGRISL